MAVMILLAVIVTGCAFAVPVIKVTRALGWT